MRREASIPTRPALLERELEVSAIQELVRSARGGAGRVGTDASLRMTSPKPIVGLAWRGAKLGSLLGVVPNVTSPPRRHDWLIG